MAGSETSPGPSASSPPPPPSSSRGPAGPSPTTSGPCPTRGSSGGRTSCGTSAIPAPDARVPSGPYRRRMRGAAGAPVRPAGTGPGAAGTGANPTPGSARGTRRRPSTPAGPGARTETPPGQPGTDGVRPSGTGGGPRPRPHGPSWTGGLRRATSGVRRLPRPPSPSWTAPASLEGARGNCNWKRPFFHQSQLVLFSLLVRGEPEPRQNKTKSPHLHPLRTRATPRRDRSLGGWSGAQRPKTKEPGPPA